MQFKFLPAANSRIASILQQRRICHAPWRRRVRPLQNVDDPGRFIHEIEYDTHEVIEVNRQRSRAIRGAGASAT